MANGPRIERAVLIDDRHIELYWNTQVRQADREDCFRVTRQGRELRLVHWKNDGCQEWDVGTVYQKESVRTTVTLEQPVPPEVAGELRVEVVGPVTDLRDNPVDHTAVYPVTYSPYYRKHRTTETGILVRAGENVSDYALELTGKIVDRMLAKIPEVAAKLVELHADVGIYSLKENAYDIPEHRMGYLLATRPVEGFGGTVENPVSSVAEANVIRLRTGRYATRYPHEMILVHEFGHAIHLIGINSLEDQTLARNIRDCYEHARAAGLWKDSYAISNYEEYFATLGTVWYNVMEEGVDGTWDGIRGPVNTREELQEYDEQGYRLMESIYSADLMPAPWNSNPDWYDCNGVLRREAGNYHREMDKFDWDFIQ